ncbi:MAG TPA: hypothetical protein VK761_00625 [Solirubrobacteraceae bacterium]|nr:hypothetical protein [Solirubrobacteraceae bacterium]
MHLEQRSNHARSRHPEIGGQPIDQSRDAARIGARRRRRAREQRAGEQQRNGLARPRTRRTGHGESRFGARAGIAKRSLIRQQTCFGKGVFDAIELA